jgi:peptidoglycan/LPS O-acetylase OafA/YrhL
MGILGAFLLIGTSHLKYLVHIPTLRFFGRISYGLYLVHILVFNAFDRLVRWHGLSGLALRFCVATTVAIALAWLSREYFEERFLRNHSRVSVTAVTTPGSLAND